MSSAPLAEETPPYRRPLILPFVPLFALLLVGTALGYLIWGETPRGRIEGDVVLTDYAGRPLANCDVYLNLDEGANEAQRSRRTTTDSKGHFVLSRVAVGKYTLGASSKWHSSENVSIVVEEAQTASRTIKLTRSEPDINIGDHQSAFTTGEKPFLPVRGYINTKSSGTLAPAGQASPPQGKGGEMRVRLWRTRLSNVLKRADAADALDRLRYTYDGPTEVLPAVLLAAPRPELVAETTLPIHFPDREGFYVERIPLLAAKAKPGLYLAQFTHGKKSVCSYILVSDLALVTKRSRSEMLGYAVDMRRGTPVAGADLRYYQNGSLLQSKRTGANGLARLSVSAPAGGTEATPVAVAVRGDDEAVVSRANYFWSDEGAGGYTVHTVTDRTVYRPGDTIQYKGITRQRRENRDGSAAYDVPRGVPVTVEVRDPSGALVTRETRTTNGSGSFWGSVELSPEGSTGSYSLVTEIGGDKRTTELVVASYRKPEFTVKVTPNQARYVRGEPVEMTIQGTYYFGSPVAGAKVHYYAYRDADWMATYNIDPEDLDSGEDPRGYFNSGGAYGSYYGQSVADGEVTLDENGKAVVRLRTDKRQTDGDSEDEKDTEVDLPQAETYTLTAIVTDDADRTVETEGAARVSAGDVLVSVEPEGYLAAPGKKSEVFVSVRDQEGRPVTNSSVTLEAFFERWDKKTKKNTIEPAGAAQTAKTGPDGRAYLAVTPGRTGEMRLAATAQDKGGRTVRAEAGLWVAGDSGEDLDTDYGDLSLLTDKREYAPGDTARVLVNSSRTGQTVLLTVEGEQIYRTYSVPVTKRSTVVRVPVQEGWGPNVTLAACYVRDKKFASSQTPLRVSIKARELTVAVRPVGGDKYGPRDTVTYAVETRDTATNRPASAEFALSVVDESIYALRADDPKALRRSFYPRRTSQVSTSYSFSVEYLGDVSKAEPTIEARSKFRDTAYWRPALRTDGNGRATVSVTLPDNLTTWRATVNAVTDQTAVGYGASKVISSKPFFVRLEKPRFLTGGDESRLLAIVHNETGAAQTALIRLQAKTLTVTGKDTQTVQVPAGGVGKVEWTVRAADAASGDAPLRVTAWTPKESGGTQYTDGVEQSLAVRAYGRTDFATFAGVLSSGGEAAVAPSAGMLTAAPHQAALRLDAAAVPAETRLTLRITPSVRGALTAGIEYLVGFPYGCTEQTLSRFYPDLLAQSLGMAGTLKQGKDLPRMVRDGVARLAKLQHSETGGWGWWEQDKDDAFMTAYALIGLTEARAQGYPIEESLLTRGREAGEKLAKTCRPEERAFLLYALSVAGYDDAKTNLLHTPFRYSKIRTKLDPTILPTDSLAYLTLLGRRIGADASVFESELERRAVVEGRLIHWKATSDVKKPIYSAVSDRMATALVLRVLLAGDPADDRITAVLRWLMQSRTDGYWGDTRDTSWVLTALCDYLRTHPEENTAASGEVAIRVNGQTVRTVNLATDAQGEPEILLTLPTNSLRSGPNTLEVVRENGEAGGAVFYSGALRQTLAAPAGAELPAMAGQGIAIKREVVRVLPQQDAGLWRLATEAVKDGRFRQGDRLRVRLVITAERDASYVLIEDAFPSGAEVTERGTAEQEISGDSWSFWYDHVDVRDDRIAFFARRLPKGKHVIEYNLRAQTPGVSRALPTHIEGMYDPAVKAESAGTRVEVAK